MTTPMTEQRVTALGLSEGAQAVLEHIAQLTGKQAGEIMAEGLSLAKLYEENRRQGGRLLRERNGKVEEIVVP